jgi:hypothetical protein
MFMLPKYGIIAFDPRKTQHQISILMKYYDKSHQFPHQIPKKNPHLILLPAGRFLPLPTFRSKYFLLQVAVQQIHQPLLATSIPGDPEVLVFLVSLSNIVKYLR